MPIDPSIPLSATKPLDPMQTMGNFVGLQGNMLQQRALGQMIGANEAASGAMRGSVDPNTGKIDYNRFTSLMAQDPRGAYNLPTIQGQILEQQNKQQTLETAKYELLMKQQNGLRTGFGALMLKPDLSPSDVVSFAAQQVSLGAIPNEVAAKQLAGMPQDPGALRAWVAQHFQSAQNGETQLKMMMPNVQQINSGGATSLLPLNPMTGQMQGGQTSIQNTMTPGDAAQPVTVYDPATGTQRSITRAQFAGQGQQPGQQGQQAPGAPGFQSAPALGQGKIADAAAERYNALTQAASDAPTAINGYDRALEALKGTGSGQGKDAAMMITGALNSFGLPVATDSTANFQSLKKYLANAASTAAAASGYSGSDARMAAFSQGQPDPTKMNPKALEGAIQYVKALQSGVMAKNNAAQAYLQANGGNTASLPKFETQWSNAFSPDVMELRNMDPTQQAAYISGLKPEQKTKLMKSYQAMSTLGAF